MSHTQSAMRLPPPTATPTDVNTTTSSSLPSHQHRYQQQQRHAELPLPHPIYHSISPTHRAEFQAWLQEHETDIGGLLFIFIFLLILGGLWRSRRDFMQWYFERRREKARRQWVERERERRRRVVVVGILRKSRSGGGAVNGNGNGNGNGVSDAEGEGKGNVGKRVRFLDGLDGLDDVVVVDGNVNERADEDVVVDFLEDGTVVGEAF
ncbi:hypothetical protein IFR05_007065 [Cadophora sp. M221]|nr:hypothetical protein IFR05_007065 [Cadophora sp. M221]